MLSRKSGKELHYRGSIWALRLFLYGLPLLLVGAPGCSSSKVFRNESLSAVARRISPVAPIAEAEEHHEEVSFLDQIAHLPHEPRLEGPIATFRKAEAARHAADANCVSLYAQTALACWSFLPESETTFATHVSFSDRPDDSKVHVRDAPQNVAWKLYHHSLQQMTENAIRFKKLDLQRGIPVVDAEGHDAYIAITHHGFPWQPEDFNSVRVVKKPIKAKLKRYWSDPGLGVSLVAIRERDKPSIHMGKTVPYSATAVLRPKASDLLPAVQPVSYHGAKTIGVLELHDPLRVTQYADASREWDLARDVSAPLGLAQSQLHRDNLKSFLNPDREDENAGLRMIEPYQRGKIPIVFIHGLLSDRVTWIDLINDLRHSPWISRHYQIWLYQYPTGQPFIVSAAKMRIALQDALREADPRGSDEALSEMVLVGHSMGGLVSKLMITRSGDELWHSIASVPPDEVKIPDEKRREINSIFFFEPLPFVKRVVFIGSPHQGSSIATSWVGALGSTLVHRSKQKTKETKTILHDNPGVFKDLEKHLPTSVDLLRPNNPILKATYLLPVSSDVRLHTIIGTAKPLRDGTPADGVVPIESAQHPGTISEKRIKENHTGLPDHPETSREVSRILSEHLRL